MLRRNLLRKASHMLVPSLLLTSACWGGGGVPELSPLATSLFCFNSFPGWLCAFPCFVYCASYTIFLYVAHFHFYSPSSLSSRLTCLFDLLLVLDISNVRCWELNMWYFPPNSLLPQSYLSGIEHYPPGSSETINKTKHESIVIILFHCQPVNRTYWLNFQNVSQFWILLTIIIAILNVLSGILL